jgi:hypothetical protein
MKERAKELDAQRRSQRASGSKTYGNGISSNMYNNSSINTKPDITPTPVSYSSSSSPYVISLFNMNKEHIDQILDRLFIQVKQVVMQ